MQMPEKMENNGSLDGLFLGNNLDQLSRKNSLYREALTQMKGWLIKLPLGELFQEGNRPRFNVS